MSKSRNYIITLNNPEGDAEEILRGLIDDSKVVYVVGQLELGDNMTPHIQAFIGLNAPMLMSYIKKLLPRAHIESARDVAASKAYCQKEDTRIAGPWQFGEDKQEKIKTGSGISAKRMLEMTEEQLLELTGQQYLIAKKVKIEHSKTIQPFLPADVRGEWFYGVPGAGKSRKAHSENPGAYLKA